MKCRNKVFLLGNVGNDPELKTFDSGTVNVTLSLATNEKYKDKNGEIQTVTEWHRLVAWGKLAEVIDKYVKKGAPLDIEGKLQTRSYEKDGVTHYTTEIILSEIRMLGGDPNKAHQNPPANTNEPVQEEIGEDDLPF